MTLTIKRTFSEVCTVEKQISKINVTKKTKSKFEEKKTLPH